MKITRREALIGLGGLTAAGLARATLPAAQAQVDPCTTTTTVPPTTTTAPTTTTTVPPSGGRIPGVYGPDDLLPGGAKIRGTNIAVAVDATWALFWKNFEARIPAITQQLDLAVSVGCNVVRLIGSVLGVANGTFTRAEYLAHWDHFNQLCADRGLYIYPCAQHYYDTASGYPSSFTTIPQSTLIAEEVAFAQHVDQYGRCIGIDLVCESNYYAPKYQAPALYNAVKQVTSLPLTFSLLYQSANDTPTMATMWSTVNSRADFCDIHWYGPAVTATTLDPYFAGNVKPFVVGEFGSPDSQGYVQTQRYQQAAAAIGHTTPGGHRAAGAFNWTIQDYSTDPANRYGLFDTAGNPKTQLTSIFQTIPKT